MGKKSTVNIAKQNVKADTTAKNSLIQETAMKKESVRPGKSSIHAHKAHGKVSNAVTVVPGERRSMLYILVSTFIGKMITFFVNSHVMKWVSPELFGLATIQCDFIINSMLMLVREP